MKPMEEWMKELINMELSFDKAFDQKAIPPEELAMAYTCLAHDWYHNSQKEHGYRLLLKATFVCPMYFSGLEFMKQVKTIPQFDVLVKKIDKHINQIKREKESH